jgi:hypothetical protein
VTVGPLPTPVPQLDGSPQAKFNCGPASTASLISHADRNAWHPTPSETRAAGQMGTGPTGFAEQKRAVVALSQDPRYLEQGLEPMDFRRLGYVEREQVIELLVYKGNDVLVAIRYSVVNKLPQYSSDHAFDGFHFVTGCRLYVPIEWGADGKPTLFHRVRPRRLARVIAHPEKYWTVVVDPLADHRRPDVPHAPQLWPLTLLLDAGDAFYDAGAYDGKMPVAVMRRSQLEA